MQVLDDADEAVRGEYPHQDTSLLRWSWERVLPTKDPPFLVMAIDHLHAIAVSDVRVRSSSRVTLLPSDVWGDDSSDGSLHLQAQVLQGRPVIIATINRQYGWSITVRRRMVSSEVTCRDTPRLGQHGSRRNLCQRLGWSMPMPQFVIGIS